MAYNFQNRIGHTNRRMKQLNKETVTYIRGDEELTISASPILRQADEIIVGQSICRVEIQTWGIDTDDLEFEAGVSLPITGDTIIRTNGEEYLVKSLTDGPPYVFTTSSRARLLLTTQLIGSDL